MRRLPVALRITLRRIHAVRAIVLFAVFGRRFYLFVLESLLSVFGSIFASK